jgi:serine O-acetyltransferase
METAVPAVSGWRAKGLDMTERITGHMGLVALIGSDLRAKAQWLYGGNSARLVCKALFTDGTFAMLTYRLMQASHRARLTPLAMLFNKLGAVLGQCIIGRGAEFGPEFVLIHSHGIVINAAVRGGAGIRLEHQVTIGAEKGAAPELGDGVFVGAGARILGGVRVGAGAKIGANAVVVTDVPPGATAVGVPARVIAGAAGQGGGDAARA